MDHQHHHHHSEDHFEGSDLVKDIVIGMADGLTVPFALAAGLSGAVDNTLVILTAGVAEIAAGSIAMGLGGYLAGRTDVDHYNSELRREYDEIKEKPEAEKREVREIFAEYGLSEDMQHLIANEMAKRPDDWVNFMMRFELGLEKPDERRAAKSAANIGLSYIVGGFIPLLPYLFCSTAYQGLIVSAIVTLIALFIFGYFKSRVTGQPPIQGALKTMLIGAIAAGVAFGVAKLIHVD